MNTEQSRCELCGEPMPEGEEMFNFHGYSGPCPKPMKPIVAPKVFTAAEVDAITKPLTEEITALRAQVEALAGALRAVQDYWEGRPAIIGGYGYQEQVAEQKRKRDYAEQLITNALASPPLAPLVARREAVERVVEAARTALPVLERGELIAFGTTQTAKELRAALAALEAGR